MKILLKFTPENMTPQKSLILTLVYTQPSHSSSELPLKCYCCWFFFFFLTCLWLLLFLLQVNKMLPLTFWIGMAFQMSGCQFALQP